MPGYEKEGGMSERDLKRVIDDHLTEKKEREQQKKRLDGIEKKLELVGNMVCDEKGKCRLATVQDIERIGKQQAESGINTIDKAYKELDGQWEKLSPEQKKKLKVIPKGAHETMFEEIFSPDSKSRRGGIKKVLREMSKKEWEEILNEEPEILVMFLGGLCRTKEECQRKYNVFLEQERKEVKQEGKGQKEHFLVKKK